MRHPPSAPVVPTRRHRSVQRERLLAWLRDSDSHPSASEIHAALAPELPGLSLATVYRNLDVLRAEGEVEEVACAVGPTRYDANPDPHHHFHCDRCGRIRDVDVAIPAGLTRRLARDQGLHAQRVRISFHGHCSACRAESDPKLAEEPTPSVGTSAARSRDSH